MDVRPEPLDLRRALDAFHRLAALQSRAARVGTPHVGADGLSAMHAADQAERDALARGDVEAAIDADDAFHAVLVRACGDLELAAEVRGLLQLIRRFDRAYFASKAFDATVCTDDHLEVIAAVEAGDAELAAAIVERNWTQAGERMSAALSR